MTAPPAIADTSEFPSPTPAFFLLLLSVLAGFGESVSVYGDYAMVGIQNGDEAYLSNNQYTLALIFDS